MPIYISIMSICINSNAKSNSWQIKFVPIQMKKIKDVLVLKSKSECSNLQQRFYISISLVLLHKTRKIYSTIKAIVAYSPRELNIYNLVI